MPDYQQIKKTLEKEGKKPEDLLGKVLKRQHVVVQRPGFGIEAFYFWIINFMRNKTGLDYQIIDKISDIYSATETSSYFGMIEQRKGLQQDKVSQFMATIGKMTKDLFQIIRELRIIDERLAYYIQSRKGSDDDQESAEIALKGIWIDVVEGGAKNPASVYGLAQQVGFVTLPDLFFKIRAKNKEDVDRVVDALKEGGMNRKIREVLKRKLFQYYSWKERTEKELSSRRKFMLQYLRQHYHVIKLYMHWIKPYLRNIVRLQMAQTWSPELITSFESSLIELEIVATKENYFAETDVGWAERKYKNYVPVLRVSFRYVTIPEMQFQQEFQRGAIHLGRAEMIIEGYVTEKQKFEEYKKVKEYEDYEMLIAIEESMKAMADELGQYLKEAEDIEASKEFIKEEPKRGGFWEPFAGIGKGFEDVFRIKARMKDKWSGYEAYQEKNAAGAVRAHVFILYDIFKKNFGLLSF